MRREAFSTNSLTRDIVTLIGVAVLAVSFILSLLGLTPSIEPLFTYVSNYNTVVWLTSVLISASFIGAVILVFMYLNKNITSIYQLFSLSLLIMLSIDVVLGGNMMVMCAYVINFVIFIVNTICNRKKASY